jgi:two-component system, sporulation sensor kinase E
LAHGELQILFNLIKNSSEQIALNNKGEIYIRTEETATHNIISIKDTAGGVSHELEGKLFQDYFTTKKHGTGIGLSSSKRLMNHFNGTLTYINLPGESIEFILSFPKISAN